MLRVELNIALRLLNLKKYRDQLNADQLKNAKRNEILLLIANQ
jgi:hypothetical protein